MKITVSPFHKGERPDVYLARERASGALVVVGRHGAVVLESRGGHRAGNGWTGMNHDLFDPLRPGEVVTIEN